MAGDDHNIGRVVQVIGPVVDVEFQEHHLPEIYNAVRITSEGFDVPEPIDVIVEVQQHLGEGRVRTVAMKPTEGMVRGMKAIDTGRPHHRAGGPRDAGARAQRAGRAGRQSGRRASQDCAIRFTARRLRWKISPRSWKCSKRASRSWT